MMVARGRIRSPRWSLRGAAAAAAMVVASGCGVSDETPRAGAPEVIAATPAATPVIPVSLPGPEVKVEPAAEVSGGAAVAPENVTYGDAEKVFRAGRYDEATGLFEAYTVRKPENVWGHYMLGISAWKSGDHEKAESALLRALELDPENGKTLVNLSRVLLEQNRPAAALDFAEDAVTATPESVDAWRVLGNVRSALGAVEPAVEAYRRALVLDDVDTWSMNNLGLLYIRDGRYDESIPPLARAIELKPSVAVFQNNLGVALERTGHLTQAAEAYRAALEADPEYTKAKLSLERVEARMVTGGGPSIDLRSMAGMFSDEIAFLKGKTEVKDTTFLPEDSVKRGGGW